MWVFYPERVRKSRLKDTSKQDMDASKVQAGLAVVIPQPGCLRIQTAEHVTIPQTLCCTRSAIKGLITAT